MIAKEQRTELDKKYKQAKNSETPTDLSIKDLTIPGGIGAGRL